ncbi:PepSY-like domain-containing protein [Chitinophaga vietnamensis]|uniref:PepSY-like domain-containing protein n=1 Tax=Chitinophaga vietnamensis TaxID=2593957 RepID=UPI001177D475|nr:PepSY-like domain-containing protein [Chitinophaga vietnamensis]
MKKYILLLLAGMGFSLAGYAQVKVPATVKSAFEKAYSNVSYVTWSKEGKTGYEATFVQGGKHLSVVYDAKGALEQTEEVIKTEELPAGVADYVKQHYKGAAITEAAKIIKAGGEVNYEAEVKKKDLIFDANGKFLKEMKEDKD